jgi:hypothetical protein
VVIVCWRKAGSDEAKETGRRRVGSSELADAARCALWLCVLLAWLADDQQKNSAADYISGPAAEGQYYQC